MLDSYGFVVLLAVLLSGGPWFNLFNLGGKSEAEMKKLKLNEIKNGRLAMLAVFGYGAQVGRDRGRCPAHVL